MKYISATLVGGYARKRFHMLELCFLVFERTTTRTNFSHLVQDRQPISAMMKTSMLMCENSYDNNVIVNVTLVLG